MEIYFKFCFFLVVAVSLLKVVSAKPPALSKLENDIEARRLNVNHADEPKSARAYLDNDFESGSSNPWYDESPGYVNWQVEDQTSPVEKNSSAPVPALGTKYLRATRNAQLLSGLAVLSSPAVIASPGDQISFDFWIRSKRPEGNNLELVWVVNRVETLLVGLSKFSTAVNFEWRRQSVLIPVNQPTSGVLKFYGYCGTNDEDAIAIDNIIVESGVTTTPSTGTPSSTTSPTGTPYTGSTSLTDTTTTQNTGPTDSLCVNFNLAATSQPRIETYEVTTLPPIIGTCGGSFTGYSGVIASPNYPYSYCNNHECLYSIQVPVGYRAYLYINAEEFNTEAGHDFVTVYNGKSTSDPVLTTLSGPLGLSPSIYATSNEMLVKFTSDGSGTSSGWRATYSIY